MSANVSALQQTKVTKDAIKAALQPSNKIKGIVKDQDGDAIIGASITVKGTRTGTSSDISGNFEIDVPYDNASIVFSYLGYQPQEIALEGRKTLIVVLIEDSKALEEVVVIGYTTQRKESITGSVSTITTKDLLQSPTANINNALAGRLPGLIVNQYNGGEPGVDKSELFIRGKATWGDQSPIVIVDGIERDMSYISADEIETFTILKDASATAPYGIRGANGVIVVTTKRGKAQDGATVNFKSSYGFNSPSKLPSLLGSADYATLYNEAIKNDNPGADPSTLNLFSSQAIDNFRRAKGDNSDGLGYDWDYFDYLFKTGKQQDNSLSVRGGNDKARYYVLGAYMQQGGNYKHTDLSAYDAQAVFKRYNFRSNIDVNITKRFWIKLDLGARITDRTAPGTTAEKLIKTVMTQPPYLPMIVESNGNVENSEYQENNPLGMLYGDQIYRANLLGELSRTGYEVYKNTYLEGSYSMGHDLDFIAKGLKIDATFSYDASTNQSSKRTIPNYSEGYREYPGYATFQPMGGSDVYMNPGHYEGAYRTGNKYDKDQAMDNGYDTGSEGDRTYYQIKLSYINKFNDLHEVSALGLFNRSKRGGKQELDVHYQGLTSQLTYNYNKLYLAEVNMGYNGSENFAKGKRYGFFPAASLGWVISSESFMNGSNSWLNHLKVRGSFGLVGNDKLPVGRWAYLAFFEDGDGYDFGVQNFNTNPGGLREGRLANPNLTWEKARKVNVGIDAVLIKHKMSFSVDVFRENRFDIINNLEDGNKLGFPTIVGKAAPLINSGKVRNHGVDIEWSWSDKIGKDFRYFIKPNFTFARNKIEFMNELDREPWRAETGKRIGENFLYTFDHFVKNQAEADQLNAMNNGAGFQPWGKLMPGDVVYKDINGDGKIDDLGDRVSMGNPRSPEIQFGLPITFQYKGFDLSILFQGSANTSVTLTDGSAWDFPQYDQDKLGKVRPMHLNRWTPETAETATYPALHMGAHSNNKNSNSGLFQYDAKYVRLKNLEVGYSLPRSINRIAGLQQVRLYAQGQNLITWDGLGDMEVDPEIGRGTGYWYPVLKVFNFGVDITF
ncbi:SusC/RagA family TonB-linked outer membrane protein [Bacteroidales bacterium]|nr:SusC/RagA family TonB-linked outer membrane protein [Bacteroidales bacterium]